MEGVAVWVGQVEAELLALPLAAVESVVEAVKLWEVEVLRVAAPKGEPVTEAEPLCEAQ